MHVGARRDIRRWGQGVLAPNGVIYCAPCDETGVLCISTDKSNNQVSLSICSQLLNKEEMTKLNEQKEREIREKRALMKQGEVPGPETASLKVRSSIRILTGHDERESASSTRSSSEELRISTSSQVSSVGADTEAASKLPTGYGSGCSIVIQPSSLADHGKLSLDHLRDSIVKDVLGSILTSWTIAGWADESEFAEHFDRSFTNDTQLIVVARGINEETEKKLVDELNARLMSVSFVASRRFSVGNHVRASPSADGSLCLGAFGSGATGTIIAEDSSSLEFKVAFNGSENLYTQEQLELVSASL